MTCEIKNSPKLRAHACSVKDLLDCNMARSLGAQSRDVTIGWTIGLIQLEKHSNFSPDTFLTLSLSFGSQILENNSEHFAQTFYSMDRSRDSLEQRLPSPGSFPH